MVGTITYIDGHKIAVAPWALSLGGIRRVFCPSTEAAPEKQAEAAPETPPEAEVEAMSATT